MATHLLHRNIKFCFKDRHQLADDVRQCRDKLDRDASFRHVVLVLIEGPRSQNGVDDGKMHQAQRHDPPSLSSLQEGMYGPFQDAEQLFGHAGWADDQPAGAIYEFDQTWQPLASIKEVLPGLADAIYRCSGQFPPCLLHALHRHRPQCRLHISSFKLRSIAAPVLDDYEYQLATSPCLYSIGIRYKSRHHKLEGPYNIYGSPDYTEEAVAHLAAGLAPNLSRVVMVNSFLWPKATGFPSQNPGPPWRADVRENSLAIFKQSPLRYLHLECFTAISRRTINALKRQVNFEALETLRLGLRVNPNALKTLANEELPSLRSLSIRLELMPLQDPAATTDYFNSAERFLCRVPPLSTWNLGHVSMVSAWKRSPKDMAIPCENCRSSASMVTIAFHSKVSNESETIALYSQTLRLLFDAAQATPLK